MNRENLDKLKWLEDALKQTGMKATPFAKSAGISPSTLLEFLNNPEKKPPSDKIFNTLASFHNLIPLSGKIPERPTSNLTKDGGIMFSQVHAGSKNMYNQIINAFSEAKNISLWVMQGRALENEDIRDGDILFVDLKRSPKINDLVCISLVDIEHNTIQTIFRKFIEDTPVGICITCTNDETIEQNLHFSDGKRVIINGVVSMKLRIY